MPFVFTPAEIVSVILGILGFSGTLFIFLKENRKLKTEQIDANNRTRELEIKKEQDDADERSRAIEADTARKKLLEDVTETTFARLRTLLAQTETRLTETEERLGARIQALEKENKDLRIQITSLTEENARLVNLDKMRQEEMHLLQDQNTFLTAKLKKVEDEQNKKV